jgi:hydrogenase nickel incorporation protein HypB
MKKNISIEEPILDELTKRGKEIRTKLDAAHIFSLNIMASPGAGKTSIIMKTIEHLKKKYRIAVIEGDIVPIDVEKIQHLGIPVVLAHTGGSCHLDSIMMERALEQLDLSAIDLLIVENVGNLICPASFYLGTHKNVVIASVPEGDDKPYKYPTMFRGADSILLNKIDYLKTEPFDVDNFMNGIRVLTKTASVIPLSSRTDEGIESWIEWIEEQIPPLA